MEHDRRQKRGLSAREPIRCDRRATFFAESLQHPFCGVRVERRAATPALRALKTAGGAVLHAEPRCALRSHLATVVVPGCELEVLVIPPAVRVFVFDSHVRELDALTDDRQAVCRCPSREPPQESDPDVPSASCRPRLFPWRNRWYSRFIS